MDSKTDRIRKYSGHYFDGCRQSIASYPNKRRRGKLRSTG
jgi:hypothetical protein